ncbi:ATP-binding cassette domain-containing protein [Mesorhizobium sp. CAU 1732]|uniref:branched-chain amino acid ABC transporter ATP-binding protein/permease n=1 Tax=Mesorhizobium sp. CAU 1732 TaxID=3140358 RepID=UPI0032602D48
MRAGSIAGLAVLAAFLVAVPFLFGSFSGYQLGLLLLYGIAAQGIALCWGKAGFLPLGQALFFGLGAYIAGWALKTADGNWLLLIPLLVLPILVPALLAGLVGLLVFHRSATSGPYFSLITLALAMLGFQLANSLDWLTGGFNGMVGIPDLAGIDSYGGLYFVILALLAASSLLLWHLFRSPFGLLLSAIRQNEDRLQFLGFRTSRLKALAFAISAGIAGAAGALFAPHQGIVTPQAVGFLLSAELVIWTAVGGRSSITGPVLGAVLIGYLSAELRDSFSYWEIVVALIFIVVVVRLPHGLMGLVQQAGHRFGLGGPPPSRARSIDLPPRERTERRELVLEAVEFGAGGIRILNGLDLAIARPGIHCIIGPNGAGKTSAFNVLTGRFAPTRGDISWNGRSIGGFRPYEVAALGIGRKFQVPSVFTEASVAENIDIALWASRLPMHGMFSMHPYRWRSRMLARLEEIFPFLQQADRIASTLSLGQRQMLEFAMVNLSEPRLLLLDEPCAGLSTSETAHMIDAIAALDSEFQATALIIEHDMQVVERLADHVFVLHLGAKLAEGTMAEIKANDTVRAVYAGGSK